MMDGVLNVRKEKGFTSHDVVAKLRGILHMKKIGHTGTLDPEAEGVLPVVLGKATRLVDLLTEKQKTYQALLHLGLETDTQDITGNILRELPVQVSPEEVEKALYCFLGEQQQIPPMYSALKVNGKKLYELAREGKTVERKPRTVYFHDIQILDTALPFVRVSVTCSKGTYIRTFCHDAGRMLGCGGCMEELLRTASGPFELKDSLTLDEIQELVRQGRLEEHLTSVEEVLEGYPPVFGTEAADRLLLNGNPVGEQLTENGCQKGTVRMYTSNKSFIGLYQWNETARSYRPVKMFL